MKILLLSIAIEFPLATYCLAAQARADVELTDCVIEMMDLRWNRLCHYEQKNSEIWRYLSRIEEFGPHVLGFSVYLWNHLAVRELVAIAKRLHPEIQIVIGGPELASTGATEPWLAGKDVDVSVRGEGEITFIEILRRLSRHEPLHGVEGASWTEGGQIVHEASRAPIKNLGQLASPFLTGLVPSDLFAREGHPGTATYSRALIETYRGCYMQCAYCQWGNGTSSRSAMPQDRVFAEISWLLSRRVSKVFIVDAMFGYKKSWAIALLKHIVNEKRRLQAKTTFSLYHNQDFYDLELFDLYREAGAAIEVDLQSTNPQVLDKLGRGRWSTDSFDRHLAAIRQHRVPTSGAADLIIGIPGDNLESFAASLDFLLRRRLRVNLYQASLLPDTAWERKAHEDGTIASPLPPRAIIANDGFPAKDMLAARLIGHGTDLFNNYPITAEVLWRHWFDRPVDLCKAIGEHVFTEHQLMYGESHQYDWVLGEHVEALASAVTRVCPDPSTAEFLADLFQFEGALSEARWAPPSRALRPATYGKPRGADWMLARPRFARDKVRRIVFRYPVHQFVTQWLEKPEATSLEGFGKRACAVLFFTDGQAQHVAIDLGITDRILARANGLFSVREILNNLQLKLEDWTPVWNMLTMLASCGVLQPGDDDPLQADAVAAANHRQVHAVAD